MREDAYDVVIVGARVGGAILAALLGEVGARVLLVDRAQFPSPALSTHFFRGNGLVAVLDRIGVLDDVLALGSPPLVCMCDYADGGIEPIVAPFPEAGEAGFCLSVRREPLDHLLVQRALTYPFDAPRYRHWLLPRFYRAPIVRSFGQAREYLWLLFLVRAVLAG